MTKVSIVIGGHLSTAPRPYKEAQALSEVGYEVVVYGNWYDTELVRRDLLLLKTVRWTFYPVVNLQSQNRLRTLIFKLLNKSKRITYKYFGIFSESLLGYSPKSMLKVVREAKSDLTIVHSEAGLWVGCQLINEGLEVGVDFEDWFSKDLLSTKNSTRPIAQINQLESQLAHDCKYCLTTSTSMAKAMAKNYRTSEPTVVYNAFSFSEREMIDRNICDRKSLEVLSLHWFSQTIGPGRGLELLLHSLPYLDKPVEIHLRGNHPEFYHKWMKDLIPEGWDDRVFIHPTVPPSELLSRIAEHDIGLALEIPYCENKQFTISNKLFQYLQAGLAVIATETVGQKEILSSYPEIGTLLPKNDSKELALAINSFLNSPASLNRAKDAALAVAKNSLNWEYEKAKLVDSAKATLSGSCE